jgi:hypothetical protein
VLRQDPIPWLALLNEFTPWAREHHRLSEKDGSRLVCVQPALELGEGISKGDCGEDDRLADDG